MPKTITEQELDDGARFTLVNARPRSMKVAVMIVAPVIVVLVGLSAANDIHDHRWVMAGVRALFALLVVAAARFTVVGEEQLRVSAGELVWERGKNFERKCKLGDIANVEREGNQLRVYVSEQPVIVVGSGLRLEPRDVQWLYERVQAAITKALPPKAKKKK